MLTKKCQYLAFSLVGQIIKLSF